MEIDVLPYSFQYAQMLVGCSVQWGYFLKSVLTNTNKRPTNNFFNPFSQFFPTFRCLFFPSPPVASQLRIRHANFHVTPSTSTLVPVPFLKPQSAVSYGITSNLYTYSFFYFATSRNAVTSHSDKTADRMLVLMCWRWHKQVLIFTRECVFSNVFFLSPNF